MIPGFSKDLKVSSLHVGARSSAAATSRSNARRVARLGSSFSGRSGLNSPKANSPSPTVQRAEAAAGSGEHPAAAAVVVVAVSATAAAPAGAASTNASAAAAADPVPAVADLAPAATAAASTAEALELFTALLSSLFIGLFGSGSIMVVYEVSGDYNKELGAAVFAEVGCDEGGTDKGRLAVMRGGGMRSMAVIRGHKGRLAVTAVMMGHDGHSCPSCQIIQSTAAQCRYLQPIIVPKC